MDEIPQFMKKLLRKLNMFSGVRKAFKGNYIHTRTQFAVRNVYRENKNLAEEKVVQDEFTYGKHHVSLSLNAFPT